jgi:hypothetical protein
MNDVELNRVAQYLQQWRLRIRVPDLLVRTLSTLDPWLPQLGHLNPEDSRALTA